LGSPSYLPPDQALGTGGSVATNGGAGPTASIGGAGAGGQPNTGGGSSGASVGGSAAGGVGFGGASTGGTGGVSSGCAAHPIPAKTTWKVTASSSGTNASASNLCDDILTNRWSSGKPQAGDEWIEVDFGVEVTLSQATLLLGSSVNDYPRSYETRFSDIAMSTAAPLLSGSGMPSTDTVMTFPAATIGRYLRVSQAGPTTSNYWSAAEIEVQCQD
jgi:hypothetical protein